jgi:hypothetical protein
LLLQCVDLIGCSSVGRRQTRRRNLASACRRACTIAIVLIAGLVSRDAAAQASAAEPATSSAPDWITDLPLPVEPKGLPAEPAGLCDD